MCWMCFIFVMDTSITGDFQKNFYWVQKSITETSKEVLLSNSSLFFHELMNLEGQLVGVQVEPFTCPLSQERQERTNRNKKGAGCFKNLSTKKGLKFLILLQKKF